MLSTSLFTLAVLSAFTRALAQSTTSSTTALARPTVALGQCIIQCIPPAAQAVGCSFTDVPCVCASAEFRTRAFKCLQDTCSPEELKLALGLQTQDCGAIGITASSIIVSGSATDSGVSSTPTAPTSNRPNASGASTAGTDVSPGSPSLNGVSGNNASGTTCLASIILAGLIGLVL